MRNFSMRSSKWNDTAQSELDKTGDIIADRSKKVYLAGSADRQKAFMERFSLFSDRKFICGGHTDIVRDNQSIIVCVEREEAAYFNIYKQLQERGWQENTDFFQEEVYEAFYHLYIRNQIVLDRIEIIMTTFCTLNCEKCISYIPFQPKRHFPLEQLKKDADLLFSKVDFVKKLKLLGGEGFVYPYLKEFITYLYENYKEQTGEIRIGTNGTVYPSEELLAVCRETDVIIDISDYTCAVPDQCRLKEITSILCNHKIRYDVKRSGEKWLDMGFPYHKPAPKTDSELEIHYHKCAMFCRNFYQGRLYHCCSNCAAVMAGLFPDDENDRLDFNNHISKKDILASELGYTGLGYLTFCRVCQGGSEEANPNLVDVAVQCEEKSGESCILPEYHSRSSPCVRVTFPG